MTHQQFMQPFFDSETKGFLNIEPDENPGMPVKEPELEPEKVPQEDPGIQPGKTPGRDDDDDDDDDDPYHEIEIGDDPEEERKKIPIM